MGDDIQEMLDYLLDWEPRNRFFLSLQEQYISLGSLSPKQYDRLCDAYWQRKAP